MPSRKSRRPSTAPIWVILLLSVSVVAVLAAYVKLTPADRVPESLRRTESGRGAANHPSESRRADGPTVLVPKPVFTEQGMEFLRSTVALPQGEDPRKFAVNAFLQASGIPQPAARVLGVDLRDGVARLDFDEGFGPGFGSMDEATLVNGIRATLGQFPEVDLVELYVSGERIQDLGHLDLSEPQPVIRPEEWSKPSP